MRQRTGGERAGASQARRNDVGDIDPEWLSATIGAIYDCALEPERWHDVLETIRLRFNFYGAMLGIVQLLPDVHEVKVHAGFDDEWIAWGSAHPEELSRMWGGPARIEAYPLEEPIIGSEVTPLAVWKESRYYREILGPRQMLDGIVVKLAREPQLMGYLGVTRQVQHGEIGDAEMEAFRLLAPHFRRAVTISNFFDLKAVEAGTFSSVLESLSCAVVLVDANLAIVQANPAADRMLAEGRVLQSLQGRLKLVGQPAEDALRSAVRIAAENEASIGRRGIGIRAEGTAGAASVLHVLPLVRRELRPGLVQRAVAAVFVTPAGQGPAAPVDAIAMAYDLTPAEAQIFAALCDGRTVTEAAAELGIARSTARTHLLHVFEKTGCRRQAELVALAARLAPTL